MTHSNLVFAVGTLIVGTVARGGDLPGELATERVRGLDDGAVARDVGH